MGKDSERSPPSFFSQEEQKLLIQTFFDEKIQQMLDGTCRDKQVYARIAAKLGEAGYERTASECKNKINNLKTWYKRHHDRPGKPGKSGGARQKRSEIYQLLDEFMSEKPSVKPKHVLESAATQQDEGLSFYYSIFFTLFVHELVVWSCHNHVLTCLTWQTLISVQTIRYHSIN